MFKTLKQHFRILPMVIFMATLMLSVRINNLFDMLKNPAADEALDIRSREIDKKAVQLKVAEQEIDKRLKQLQDYEQRLRKLIKEYNDKERAKINALVKVYSTMKPKDAARIFNTLDIDVTVSLLKEMKPSTSSAILSQMKAEKAKPKR